MKKVNSNLDFLRNGQEFMRIDSNGNLGLGTTAPSQKMSIVVEEEPLTKWYKEGVKARGLTPHTLEIIDGSKT